jgi:hypothetical protein
MRKTVDKQGAAGKRHPRTNDAICMANQLSGLGYDVIAVKCTLGSGLITVKAFPPDSRRRRIRCPAPAGGIDETCLSYR